MENSTQICVSKLKRMKLKQRLLDRIKIYHPTTDEIFYIIEVDDGVFTVESNKGVNTYGNGLAFDDVRKAFKYIEYHIKNS